MIGGADAEQVKAIGEHRAGGLGEGQPGAVNGQGFPLAAREGRTRVVEAEEGVGGGFEVAGDAVWGAVAGGGFGRPGEVGEKGEQGGLGGVVIGPRVGLHPKIARVPQQGPGAGMGVPHPEEGIGLTLGEEVGGVEIGEVMAGGPEQRPAGGIGPEAGEEGCGGNPGTAHDRHIPFQNLSPTRADKPPNNMRDERPPNLIGLGHPNPHPREPVPAAVVPALGADGPHELGMGGGVEGDVQKPGRGDVDAGDPRRTDEPPPQYLRDAQRGPVVPPLPLGQPQRHIGRVIPTPRPRRRPHRDPLRHGDTQLVVLNGATHGVQHSAGELGGSHGTSVWEEGGDSANRFRPSDAHRL